MPGFRARPRRRCLLAGASGAGTPAAAIFDEIGRLRPYAWPTSRCSNSVNGRSGDGAIVPAVAAQYRRVLAADPVFGDFIRTNGRGREADYAYR